jgi:hypothetical protein
MAKKADSGPAARSYAAVAFLREQLQPIKSLSGFRKETHRIPDSASPSNEAFVAKLAATDLSDDLDLRFAALKSAFAFKRVDLNVSGPAEGAGTIISPYFTYHVQVSQNAANPAEVVWHRRVTDILQPSYALSDQFAEVFDKTFDTLEFTPTEPIDIETLIDRIEELEDGRIQIEYDRTATNCTLSMKGVKGEIQVAKEKVKFHQRAVADPRQLVQSLVKIQQALVDMQSILPMSFV